MNKFVLNNYQLKITIGIFNDLTKGVLVSIFINPPEYHGIFLLFIALFKLSLALLFYWISISFSQEIEYEF